VRWVETYHSMVGVLVWVFYDEIIGSYALHCGELLVDLLLDLMD